jgi:hypothetical protein
MNRHRTPTIEAAVVIALVVASALFVILKKPPGRDIAPGPHPEPAGLSWRWHTPGDPGASSACQRIEDAGGIAAGIPASWQGATVDCLEIAGQSWDHTWQNLAVFSLKELADASLGVRNLPRGEPPLAPPNLCSHDGARDIMAYLVRCALPHRDQLPEQLPGQQRTDLAFCEFDESIAGGYGLAPEWLDTPLAEIDGGRERVSACLMAHANATGQQVRLRLETPAFDMPTAEPWPNLLEGAFAGNLFPETDPDDRHQLAFGLYACQADGYDESKAPPGRVCTFDVHRCGFERTRCENNMPGAICEHNPVAQHRDEDFFADCTFADRWKPAEDEVVTVYVKREQSRVTTR